MGYLGRSGNDWGIAFDCSESRRNRICTRSIAPANERLWWLVSSSSWCRMETSRTVYFVPSTVPVDSRHTSQSGSLHHQHCQSQRLQHLCHSHSSSHIHCTAPQSTGSFRSRALDGWYHHCHPSHHLNSSRNRWLATPCLSSHCLAWSCMAWRAAPISLNLWRCCLDAMGLVVDVCNRCRIAYVLQRLHPCRS